MKGMAWGARRQRTLFALVAALLLAFGLLYYTQGLTQWQAYDDEGGYLYAAWRISLGEMPYRDFLTPQLPLFLYPGAAVLALTGYSVWAARFAMTLFTLGAAVLCLATVRRLWGGPAALLTLPLLLVQRDMFWAARFFRPEAPMLFWGLLGLWLFALGYPTRHKGLLCLAGLSLGFSVLSKLFGALFLLGLALFLLAEGVRQRDWRDMWVTGLWLGAPAIAIVGLATLLFSIWAPGFIAAVLGHHLRQGSGTPLPEVLRKGLGLYRDAVRGQPAFMALAALGAILALRERGLGRLFVWQAPTALVFLAITRDLQERHLTYLMPSLAALAGLALAQLGAWLHRGRWPVLRRTISAMLLLGLMLFALWPQWQYNTWVASWEERDTAWWSEYLQRETTPGAYIMSDYPGLNFAAQRPTTPTAAGISRGAAKSGQITGAQLIQEIEDYDVQMVLLNVAQGAHQFVFLNDYAAFKHYVQTHFHLVDRRVYDYRLIEVYHREDRWEGERRADVFGRQITLTGLRWQDVSVEPGQSLQVHLRWQKIGPTAADYAVGLRLLDEQRHVRGLGSKPLVDIDRETYWDERGLEQAVFIPTSQWPDAETTMDLYQLPVDAATPPGQYRVMLRLHPLDLWTGLPLLDEAGVPRGYDLDLGMAQVLPAREPPVVSELPMQTHLDLDMTPSLRLEGYTLPTVALRPGDRFTTSIFWSAKAQPDFAYRLRLSLRDGQRAWAEDVTDLAGPHYPTTMWRAGEVLLGLHDLTVPRETPSGAYDLVAELLDGGGVASSHTVGTLTVIDRPRCFDAPAVEQPSGTQWGEGITLLGYDLRADGAAATVVFHWQAQAVMDTSYTLFVHLLDATGRIWAQADSLPVSGDYPTTSWLPGQVVSDAYRLVPQEGAPTGEYRLAVGWYDLETGLRLPVFDAEGSRQPDDRLLIGPLSLEW